MGKSQNVSFLRGRRMRATLLDGAGRPVYGDESVVTTKGFISTTWTTVTEEGEAILVTNAGGESCVVENATPSFNGFTVEAEFCRVDFALFTLLTGQEVIKNADGVAIGIAENTDIDLTSVNFALELWMGAQTDVAPAAGSEGFFGYMLAPRLGGGVIGDVTIENAAITFTISNMGTKNSNSWGVGPYPVELVAGKPAVLSTAVKLNEHRRTMIVEVAPPEVYSGSTPLLDPTDPALTGLTSTVTGRSVAFAPTPAGTDPVFYDFGDGAWDYAETGSYTYVYDAAGTYEVTARRGISTFTKNVVITA